MTAPLKLRQSRLEEIVDKIATSQNLNGNVSTRYLTLLQDSFLSALVPG